MDTAEMDREVIGELRRRWAPMVAHRQDTGTLCEMFVEADGGGGSEACHNYGAVPAYFLSAYVLGVRLNGPVWNKQILIQPHPGDLTHAQGVVGTELGPVPVAWKTAAGGLDFSFTVPAGVKALVLLPAGPTGVVTLAGQSVKTKAQDRWRTLELGPGSYAGSSR